MNLTTLYRPESVFRPVWITAEYIALATFEEDLQVVKLKSPLLKFCLYALENDIAKSMKYIKKLCNDELYHAMRLIISEYRYLPKDYTPFLQKLPVSYQLLIGALDSEEIFAIIQRENVSIRVLTKLCHDFCIAGRHEDVLGIINAVLSCERFSDAIDLIDYVKDNKAKAVIFAKCGKYGEAYLFAKAAGDDYLMSEMEGLLLKD